MGPSRVQKGDAAVLFLAAVLVEQGLTVLQPLCEALPFDLALYYDEVFYRLQVKRAQRYKGGPRFEIPFRKTTVNSKGPKTYRYTTNHADFLVGVVVETRDIYTFPLAETTAIKATIQVDPTGSSSRVSPNRLVDPEQYRNVLRLGVHVIQLGK